MNQKFKKNAAKVTTNMKGPKNDHNIEKKTGLGC